MKRTELLNSLEQDVQRLLAIVDNEFSSLPLDVLGCRPTEDKWSALECIEHTNIANAHYMKQFERKIVESNRSNSDDFKPGMLGNYFVKMIAPRTDRSIPSPMKTFKKFYPSDHPDISVLEVFVSDQLQLLQVLKACAQQDLNRIKIVSAIGPLVTFRLGDALRFIIGHADRHIIQAKRAIDMVIAASQDNAVQSDTLV